MHSRLHFSLGIWRRQLAGCVTISLLLCLVLAPRAFSQQLSRDEIVAVQITLDQAGFSTNTIDGKWGALTSQALSAWQEANGLESTGQFDTETMARFPAVEAPIANYAVTAEDLAQLQRVPEDWLERSKLERMTFESLTEMLAERYHAKESFIRALNPQIADRNVVAVGQIVMIPNLGDVPATKPVKTQRLRINLTAKTIRAYDGDDKLIALFPCSIAAHKEKRPVGALAVQTVVLNPNYTFDPGNFPEVDAKQKSYGKLIIPPGPNNPVGTAWIGLSLPGYGIHGTPNPEQVSRTESHGCFRLANWNATRLAQMLTIGTPVEVSE